MLTTIASVAAAVLGVLAGAGGAALILALASSAQPGNQIATAAVLSCGRNRQPAGESGPLSRARTVDPPERHCDPDAARLLGVRDPRFR